MDQETPEPQKPATSPRQAPEGEASHEAGQPPTILVVHASVGSGHRSAALAVSEAFGILSASKDPAMIQGCHIPEGLAIETLDILDFGRIVFDGNKAANMFTGAMRPFYDLTWRYVLTGRLLWGGGTVWSHVMYARFTDMIRHKRPLAVVCTHIVAANAAVSARMITGQDFPILCVPTDYEIEGLWPHRTTDLFCVADEAMAETLRARKVPDGKILITGIPTRNDFRKSYDRRQIRSEFGLPQDKLVVLVLAGAYLPRPYVLFREAIDEALPAFSRHTDMHFVFVAGDDRAYADHLRQACQEHGVANATVVDYVHEMAALMATSDLAICKAGGLTVTECLCAGVPMILLGMTYGQEKSNRSMLTAMGAAMHVTTARELVETLQHITQYPQQIQGMIISGTILRHPDAAFDIARATLRLIEEGQQGATFQKDKHFLWFYWGKKPAHTR